MTSGSELRSQITLISAGLTEDLILQRARCNLRPSVWSPFPATISQRRNWESWLWALTDVSHLDRKEMKLGDLLKKKKKKVWWYHPEILGMEKPRQEDCTSSRPTGET